ncbi:hypothetical protein MCOR34_007886 [Pyricularia oryzae]|nr:hypothetical protein MCOR34_007886 [Pyricularia oryzae]
MALAEALFFSGPLVPLPLLSLLLPPPLLLLGVLSLLLLGAVGVAEGLIVKDVVEELVVCCHSGQLDWFEGQMVVLLTEVVYMVDVLLVIVGGEDDVVVPVAVVDPGWALAVAGTTVVEMAAVVVTTVGFLSSQAQSLFVVGQAIMVVALVVYIVEVLEDPEADEVELEVEEVVVDLINIALDNADTAEGNRVFVLICVVKTVDVVEVLAEEVVVEEEEDEELVEGEDVVEEDVDCDELVLLLDEVDELEEVEEAVEDELGVVVAVGVAEFVDVELPPSVTGMTVVVTGTSLVITDTDRVP